MDVSEILRRHHDGQKITYIAQVLGHDRKTIRKYLTHVVAHGTVPLDTEYPIQVLPDILPELHGRPANKKNCSNHIWMK